MFEKKVLLGDIQTDEIESLKFQIVLKDAEIERQRALIERARKFVEYGECTLDTYAAREWLKDAGGGE